MGNTNEFYLLGDLAVAIDPAFQSPEIVLSQYSIHLFLSFTSVNPTSAPPTYHTGRARQVWVQESSTLHQKVFLGTGGFRQVALVARSREY